MQHIIRNTRLVYASLLAVWCVIIGWQAAEHIRVKKSARAAVINRSQDITTTLGLVIRSQRRFGAVSQERMESALKELTKSGELKSVALLNASGDVVASAGDPIDHSEVCGEMSGAQDGGIVEPVLTDPLDILLLALRRLAGQRDGVVEEHAIARRQVRFTVISSDGAGQALVAERPGESWSVVRHALAAAIGGRHHDADQLHLRRGERSRTLGQRAAMFDDGSGSRGVETESLEQRLHPSERVGARAVRRGGVGDSSSNPAHGPSWKFSGCHAQASVSRAGRRTSGFPGRAAASSIERRQWTLT